ncbi:MAG: alpha/beta hydrolase [bacterium]|nr:MAG: alpha/beta hydrolase [bacterium]
MINDENPEKMPILKFEKQGDEINEALVFIHGWPDDQSLWDKEFERFSKSYCCVRTTLPNCGEQLDRRWGVDFPELVELISQTITQALPNHQKIIIVGHDWGAYLAYHFEHIYPERVKKMITMDVGGHFKTSSYGHALMMMSYQWWLVAAWLIGMLLPFIGNWMTRALSQYARAPRGTDVHCRMNYFYFYLWRAIFFPKKYRSSLLGCYQPRCPILYFYGKNKPYQFHSIKWEKLLAESQDSEVVAVPHAGHWLMRDQHETVAAKMEQWLGRDYLPAEGR